MAGNPEGFNFSALVTAIHQVNDNQAAQAGLRALSARATITPVSFTNEYHWGDFKGDPDKLMQRYFDAHVYLANWMTAIFMVRLPVEALTKETARAVTVFYLLDIKATGTHWIITWSLEESEEYKRGVEDGRGWMARLAPVGDELLRGDLRSLYIGWLAAAVGEMMDDEETGHIFQQMLWLNPLDTRACNFSLMR